MNADNGERMSAGLALGVSIYDARIANVNAEQRMIMMIARVHAEQRTMS